MPCPLRHAQPLLRPGRWPDVDAHGGPQLARLRFRESDHLWFIEALAVAAFVRAVLDAPPGATVLDVGANVGAYALIGAALNRTSGAVEFQPGCRDCLRAHAMQLEMPARFQIITGYFGSGPFRRGWKDSVLLPKFGCSVLASPSAVAGRWPHGLATKATRAFKASPLPANETSRVFSVRPKELLPRSGELVVKIDTEGYEIQVLEALRGYWARFFAVIFEVQPNAWKFAGVSPAVGLATIRSLMDQQDFRAASLPHRNPRSAAPAGPAVFDLQVQNWMNADEFEVILKRMLASPGRGGWLHEFALFREPYIKTQNTTLVSFKSLIAQGQGRNGHLGPELRSESLQVRGA